MDDNVHPKQTIQVVDALIKANKRFDFLLLPDRGHSTSYDPYVLRLTLGIISSRICSRRSLPTTTRLSCPDRACRTAMDTTMRRTITAVSVVLLAAAGAGLQPR